MTTLFATFIANTLIQNQTIPHHPTGEGGRGGTYMPIADSSGGFQLGSMGAHPVSQDHGKPRAAGFRFDILTLFIDFLES